MKFSEVWLREWINTELDSKALSYQITMAGLEVSTIRPVAGSFNDVVIGEIVECRKHPDIERLYLTQVHIGKNRLLNIVCNASNCRRGIKVVVATPNAFLSDSFKIKRIKLSEEKFEGMLCSLFELGIADENTRIIELPSDAPIGIDVRKYMKLDDNIIEISVTPNRSDCLSIFGIARELSVLNPTKLKEIKIREVEISVSDVIPVQVEAVDVCPRYLGRIIKSINAKAITPLWMKEKLRRCGIQSVDAITDITNYVLLELGQPVYAIDQDSIEGGIVVRMAKEKETIILFDGRKIQLTPDTLVIADYNKVLAIAGILESMDARVNHDTHNILLECAFFDPLSIISFSRRYNVHTNGSYFYERGVDPMLPPIAIEYASRLILDICGGKASLVIDVTNQKMLPSLPTIILRRAKIDRLLGYRISSKKISDILRRVGCKITKEAETWKVIAPSWRFDIKIEEDLIEEIARIDGYNNIPEKAVQADLKITTHKETNLSLKRVKSMLNDKGYQEVITYSFVNPTLQELIHPNEESIILPNPISKEMSTMRLSLWTGLLSTVVYNQNRQQDRIRIFETGFRFVPDIQASFGVRQDLMLSGAISGKLYEEHWDMKKGNIDFYDIKGDLESVLDLTGKLSEVKFLAKKTKPALHTGKSAVIYLHGECIGFIGIIHPELRKKINLNSCTAVFELEWNKISSRAISQVQKVSSFPMSRRDIAVIVSEDVPAEDILTKCKKVGGNYLIGVNLFDVYRGEDITKGYKSLAISLLIQNTNRVLEEEEIIGTVTKCIKALKEEFHVSLRDNAYLSCKD